MVAKYPFPVPYTCKQELLQLNDNDDDRSTVAHGAGNGGGGSVCFPFTPEIGGLQEAGPAPFLKKMFEMVDNPETDPIVSWDGRTGCSFVVWDPNEFAARLLPKYFKHRNFSSFIRQLNTYGFRKVHLDRWEFANAGFRRGKKHMLKSIKRRNRAQNINKNLRSAAQQTEIKKLKEEQDMLRLQILGLKQQQHDTKNHIMSIEERMTRAEWRQQQMVMFIAKLMTQCGFVHQILSKYKQRRILYDEPASKKRRLDTCNASTFSLNPSNKEESNYVLWEKLMEEDAICESGNDDTQMKIVHELEDLIETSTNSTVEDGSV